MTQPLTTDQIEELLEAEVPCEQCGKAAVFRSFGHRTGCTKDGSMPPYFRCAACYQAWLLPILRSLAEFGGFKCGGCKNLFMDVESFSDWRPF